ncbi:hypothetical protein [Rhizobium sp. IMFF44]|uniref:hypothetical protein n=1 Tax=Rhizobium sp. IMFF44 TaxID=3342350 RepID=UPI0035B7C848
MICLTLGPALARDVSDRIAYFHQDVMTEIGKSEKIFGAARYQPKSLSSVC